MIKNFDIFEALFLLMIVLIIIVLIMGIVTSVIELVYGYDFADKIIECKISHMNIDDDDYLIAVVGTKNDFSKVIKVSEEQYASYNVGDICVVVESGHNYITKSDLFTYEIVE